LVMVGLIKTIGGLRIMREPHVNNISIMAFSHGV